MYRSAASAVPTALRLRAPQYVSGRTATQLRQVGSAFLAQQVQGDSRSISPDKLKQRQEQNQIATRQNQEIMAALSDSETGAQIRFRKEDRPWEIVPQFVKRRVVDMVGVLTSEHRMEMELAINKVRPICDIDLYVVIVPTVGYVTPRAFAKSIFFDWGIGEPRGNGVLLCISQGEAEVQLITSPGIVEFFGQEFVDLLVKEIMQPHLKESRPSYAVLQATYAVARHAQEMRHYWQGAMVPLPAKNVIRKSQKMVHYGAVETSYFWVALFFLGASIFTWKQIFRLLCPQCGTWFHRVVDEDLIRTMLDDGQRMEYDNGCTQFFVQKCPKCKFHKVEVQLRDMYNDTRCLKCEDCNYHTMTKETEIVRLATKKEDGLKRETYKCHFCRVGREIDLPLYRPLDAKPEASGPWYNTLLDRAADPTAPSKSVAPKLV
jgi:uncharacterized membrane protein YgcG